MRLAASADGTALDAVKKLPTPKGFEEGIEAFKEAALELARGERIDAVVGGIAGPLDKDKTMAVGGPNIPGWWNKPLKDALERALRTVAHIENDAAIGALGEAIYGAGRGYPIVVYITVSTGVGGARVVNGRIDDAAMGFEPGAQIIDAGNALCPGWSERGYLINYVSGADIERQCGKKPYEITDEKFWDERARFLAYGLNNVTVLWSPDIIVLGGSMMNEIGIPIERVRHYLKEALNIFPSPPVVEKAELGDELSLYGALAYIGQNLR
ncbi:MAG: ROK family protein [Nitrospirae bacterium]|nr:ROK family protein [Nitrospirota bacterium]